MINPDNFKNSVTTLDSPGNRHVAITADDTEVITPPTGHMTLTTASTKSTKQPYAATMSAYLTKQYSASTPAAPAMANRINTAIIINTAHTWQRNHIAFGL